MREILLVEDSETDALLLERVLQLSGVANPLRRATTGAGAVAFLNTVEKAFRSGAPSSLAIVFIDLKLPDKSGFDILGLMHGRKAFANTLSIAISSIDSTENIKRAYSLGAHSFVSKPFTEFDLKELIRSFPDPWFLLDPARARPGQPNRLGVSPPENEAIHVWAKHREVIHALRSNMEALRNQLSDTEETFAIIDTLKQEIMSVSTAKSEPTKGI